MLRRHACSLAALLLAAACGENEACPTVPALAADDPPPGLRVVTANVGNAELEPPAYALRIREQAHEELVAAALARADAELIVLQEVLTPERCAAVSETDAALTCHRAAERAAPARRLLGEAYSIACDARSGVGCIAVRQDFGSIRGLASGALALHGAPTEPLPGEPCDYYSGECHEDLETCDGESMISHVVVETAQGPLTVVHVHPAARGRACRTRQIAQAFEAAGAGPALILGDWNFDPDDVVAVPESAVQARWTERFRCHHPRGEGCRLVPTRLGRSIDRVFSDFARGTCRTVRYDDGWRGARAMDHLGVECDLLDER